MSIWEQTGVQPAMLADAPVLPDGCGGLWADFMDLHQCRGVSGMAPARITFTDIDAWQRVNMVSLEPWEIDAINQADNAYLSQVARAVKRD